MQEESFMLILIEKGNRIYGANFKYFAFLFKTKK